MKKSKLTQTEIILISLVSIIGLFYAYENFIGNNFQWSTIRNDKTAKITEEDYSLKVIPMDGVLLPVRWGNTGSKIMSSGLIDKSKLEALYARRGGLTKEEKKLLEGLDNGNLKITRENSGFILNLLWALGLGNKNAILENGPMSDKVYGNPGNFASTGGWTLALGGAMTHYSAHKFIVLTPEQQSLVEKVSKNIYRPCCGNSTYFPDCNHGMAMLGLLELMASQGISEDEMYKTALAVNSYWFPDTYITIAKYIKSQGKDWVTIDKYLKFTGKDWNDVNPKEILGYDYSSGPGYQKLLKKIENPEIRGGGSCGV